MTSYLQKMTFSSWRLARPGFGVNAVLMTGLLLAGAAQAQSDNTQTVVISGSIVERTVADAPYAITVIDRQALRSAGPLLNLSEALGSVPGLVVTNRGNYAQDLQISSRGFGARATFGVRGIRLLTDGIPASGPDGQGQVSHFDLAGAERVEVLRGPFSVLYGNSSGGVISLISAPVKSAAVELAADAGSFGLRQLRVQGQAPLGEGFSLRANAAAMDIDGYRPNSQAERRSANLRLGFDRAGTLLGQPGSHSLVVLGSYLDQPAQDPLGLSRAQFDADPLQTTSVALQFNTRKTTRQSQLGANYRWRLDNGALRELSVSAYGGTRAITQFLAIPAGTQGNPRHGGGVIDLDRAYEGAQFSLRFAWDQLGLVLGANSDRQRDTRLGYENFTGTGASQVLGVQGRLRRDEVNRGQTDDAIAQLEWDFSPDWLASAGVRSGRVKMSSQDNYLSNGDDAGNRSYSYTNPVLGLRWRAMPGLNLHASVARGFESPTLTELAYRADGSSGFNDALAAQDSRQWELGAKWRSAALQADLALFEARAANEIGVATNAGGRAAYQNVGATLRRGAELSLGLPLTATVSASLNASWLDATYRDGFLACAGIPCSAPTVPVPAGNRIAGTARQAASAGLTWRSPGWGQWGVDVNQAGNTVVNDLNTDAAAGYATLGLRWQHQVALGGGWRGEWLVRLDNATDRRYAGSVIVNDGNGRFFETGAPRSWLVSLRVLMP